MTAHKRSVEHRMLRARQGGNGNGNGNGTADPGPGNGGNDDDGETGGNNTPPPPTTTTTTSTTTSSTSSTSTTSSTSSTRTSTSTPPPTSTSTTPTRTTSTTSSTTSTSTTASTTSSSTSSVTSTSSTATTTTSAVVNNIAGTTGRPNQISSFRDVPTMSIDSTGATVTAGPLEETGGISTGGIVGSVAGGLAALAVLGFIVAWLLRRYKKKRAADDDFGTDFRRSAFVTGSHPPSMAEVGGGSARGHTVAPSISSPGIAGQGAFSSSYGATDNSRSGAGAAAATGVAVGAAAVATGAAAAHGLQERPKYVYGQVETTQQNSGEDHHEDSSELAHGAYSSEPMAQQAYNAEAYGSYAAYDAQGYNQNYQDGANGGYQDATREYQGQEGYAVGGYDQGYGYENHPYGHQQATYDASQYAQYDPNQYAQYDQNAYVATGSAPAPASDPRHDAYGGM